MKELEQLFKDIQNQLNDEKIKHKRLKICRYCFEIEIVIDETWKNTKNII